MFSIIVLSLKTIFLLYYVGYGFTAILLPKQLKKYFIWFIPWVATACIAIFGVIFSLGKFPMNTAYYGIIGLSSGALIYVYYKKQMMGMNFKDNFLNIAAVIVSFGLSIAPLVMRVGFPTVVSLSNLDPISYTNVGDFLKNHSVWEGATYVPYSPYLWSVGDLLHYSYRWGSPMILSFFSSVFQLRGYEIYSILLTLYFALSFPLVVVLTQILAKKYSPYLWIFLFITYAFNSTLVYMLFNVFFAQFLFAGLYMSMIILYLAYPSQKEKSFFTNFHFLIAIFIASITTVYPEGLLFVLIPIVLITIFRYIFMDKNITYAKLTAKVLFLALIISPVTFQTGFRQNLAVIFANSKPGFIGWEPLPNASPIEIMGFYNLNYSRRLPFIIFSVLSLPIVLIWIIGFIKSKNKIVISSFLITFLLLLFNFRYVNKNYFFFHRTLTYGLFLFSVLFSIGASDLFQLFRKRFIKYTVMIVFVAMTIRSFYRTWYQMYWHMNIVDKSLVSLREINDNQKFQEIFYTADVFIGEYNLWKRQWRDQILIDKKIISNQNYRYEAVLPKKTYVLAEKEKLSYQGKTIKFKRKLWENEYYILGEIVKK